MYLRGADEERESEMERENHYFSLVRAEKDIGRLCDQAHHQIPRTLESIFCEIRRRLGIFLVGGNADGNEHSTIAVAHLVGQNNG